MPNFDNQQSWRNRHLLYLACGWYKKMRKQNRSRSERSPWWHFNSTWYSNVKKWVETFQQGQHIFSPLISYTFADEVVVVWNYLDRLMIYLLLQILKPTFKHLISPHCSHLKGPSQIKQATEKVTAALKNGNYSYVMRVDIRSFYASIDHKILLKQVNENLDDPKMVKYLSDVITVGIDKGGQVYLPKKGIPLRSSLSPFFGALYLAPLDKAFAKCKNIFYLRYMDDIIILIENKHQFAKAKKRLFKILRELNLQISGHKTRIGAMKNGFHFLGVNFAVARTPQTKTQVISVGLHRRTYQRALDRVKALYEDAVNPAKKQRYLMQWATWWCSKVGDSKFSLICSWLDYAKPRRKQDDWLVTPSGGDKGIYQGLLLDTPYDGRIINFNNLS